MKHEEKAKLSKREQFAQLRSDFTTFLYNKEGDEPAVVMGRTALSWGKFSSFEIFRIIIHLVADYENMQHPRPQCSLTF